MQGLLDESLTTIALILSNKFVAGINEEVDEFHVKLKTLQATLDEWLVLQASVCVCVCERERERERVLIH
jgi:hypothetical protein